MGFGPGAFVSWPRRPRLARSLRTLAREVDRRWPSRSSSSDGWIGDSAHAARASDHNPDALGIVRALDVTAAGIDPAVLVRAAINHPSTRYVIFDATIRSRVYGFRSRPYAGPDPHRTHVHISIGATRREASRMTPWLS